MTQEKKTKRSLVCEVCGSRNYRIFRKKMTFFDFLTEEDGSESRFGSTSPPDDDRTAKLRAGVARFQVKKFCPTCGSHTLHLESK